MTSTFIVESRRSSAAARAVLVLNQIQLSFIPWPIVLEPLSRSYSARFLSYSSRVTFAFDLFVLAAAGVAFTKTAVLLFAFRTFAFVLATGVVQLAMLMTNRIPPKTNSKRLRFLIITLPSSQKGV